MRDLNGFEGRTPDTEFFSINTSSNRLTGFTSSSASDLSPLPWPDLLCERDRSQLNPFINPSRLTLDFGRLDQLLLKRSMYSNAHATMPPPQSRSVAPETFLLDQEAQNSLPPESIVALQQVDNRTSRPFLVIHAFISWSRLHIHMLTISQSSTFCSQHLSTGALINIFAGSFSPPASTYPAFYGKCPRA